MFRGQLRMGVLTILGNHPASGYAIMKQLGELTGKKPSAGSLYPLLEDMRREGLLRRAARGKRTVYALSAKARHLQTAQAREELVRDIVARVRMCDLIAGTDAAEFVEEIFTRIQRGERPFGDLERDFERHRNALLRLLKQDKVRTHRRAIRSIVRTATKRLEALQ